MMGPKNIERQVRYMECGCACTVVELNFSLTIGSEKYERKSQAA
jgi:hypothetical protein